MAASPMVTMAQVAARAGVSTATVSRALHGERGVSAPVKARIEALASELGYVISPEASNLAGGMTGRVAVLGHDLRSWYMGAVLAGIHGILSGASLDLLLYCADTAAQRAGFFERLPARRKVDALIVVAVPITDVERSRLDLMGVHVVAAGRCDRVYPSVFVDDALAAQQAVNHLVSLGHRRIGLLNTVSADGSAWPSHADRRRGYVQALHEAALPVREDLMVSTSIGQAGGARGMDRLLSAVRPPTAVFAYSDEVAIGALRSLRRARLGVPDDMSVVGVDDHPMAELTDLTTVRQDAFEIGRIAAQLVVDELSATGHPRHPTHDPGHRPARCPTHLVIRGTTAPPGGR